MDGAMQQAPQPGRQFISCRALLKQELLAQVLRGLQPHLLLQRRSRAVCPEPVEGLRWLQQAQPEWK